MIRPPHNPVPFDLNLVLAELDAIQILDSPPYPEVSLEDIEAPNESKKVSITADSFEPELVLSEIVAEFDTLYAIVESLRGKIEALRSILPVVPKSSVEGN